MGLIFTILQVFLYLVLFKRAKTAYHVNCSRHQRILIDATILKRGWLELASTSNAISTRVVV